MTTVLVVLIALLMAAAFIFMFKKPGTRETMVTQDHIPFIVDQLSRRGTDGSFVMMMFAPDRGVQYAVDDGHIGLDWIVQATNRSPEEAEADKAAVMSLLTVLGHTVVENTLNDVHYLRTENGNLAVAGSRIIRDVFKYTGPLDLVQEGFVYKPFAA